MRTRNLAVVKRAYAAYAKGDPEPFFDSLAPEVDFRLCCPEGAFPFAGRRRGPAAVRAAIDQVRAAYEWLDFHARGFVAEADRVVAFTGGRIRHRASGVMMAIDIADVIRLADGKIVEFAEYFDSAGLLAWQAGAPVSSKGSPLGARFAAQGSGDLPPPERSRVELVRAMYAAYAQHDPRLFLDRLRPDATYFSNARSEDFSFARPCRGREAVRDNLARIAAEFDLERFELRETVADGPWVVALGEAAFRHRASGRLVEVEKVDLFRWEDHEIADFFEFFDTASSLLQMHAAPGAAAAPA